MSADQFSMRVNAIISFALRSKFILEKTNGCDYIKSYTIDSFESKKIKNKDFEY